MGEGADAANEPLIEVERVSFTYEAGRRPALTDASLTLSAGEIVAIIGQNGSGKTTLAKHLNGLLKPANGRVLVRGQDTREAQVGSLARYVGYVFQNPDHALFLPTVREEIAYGPLRLGLSEHEADARVEDALERFHLREFSGRHPAALGRGLRRLAVLAATYAMDPAVLVLDEPTGGLDGRLEAQLMDIVLGLAADGRAVVLITHEMQLVARFAQRAVLLAGGRILADDAPVRVFADPELMERAGLQPPAVARLAQRLSRYGLPGGVTTVDAFIDAYERLVKRGEVER